MPTRLILKLYAMALFMNPISYSRTGNSKVLEDGKDTFRKVLSNMKIHQNSLFDVLGSLKKCLGVLPLFFNALRFLCEPLCILINDKCEDILGESPEITSSIMQARIDEVFIEFINIIRAYR